MKTFYFFVAILAISFSANAQTAASGTAQQIITVNLTNQIDISFTAEGGKSFTFDTPQKYEDGITNTNASTIQVRSNRDWVVSVKADAASFAGANGNMNLDIFSIGKSGGTLNTLTQTDTEVANGTRGKKSFSVDYKANPGFAYDEDSYSVSITYTATQQ